MKKIGQFEKKEEVELYQQAGFTELLFGHLELSRFGTLSLAQIKEGLLECKRLGMKAVLEWDILMTEKELIEKRAIFELLMQEGFSSIRVQDMGSAQFIKQHFPDKKIQLILENAHHNLKSILTQCDYWGKQLERVILSLELPQEILGQYVKSIHERGVQTEILSLGRILLFYSPRKLLSPLEISQEQFAASEESPHKGFPVIQNSHGTFMFHTKDFFLMDKISELDSMGMDFVRIDLRFGKDKSLLKLLANPQELKEQYPVSTMQSFFRSNQTDKIFSRLKNSHTQRLDAFFVGVVLDGDPAEPLYILVKNHKINLQLGQTLHVITPQGKEKNIVLDFMQNTQGEKLQKLEGERILLIPRKGAIPAGSAIYVEQIK